ncbi:hypothetical protein [Geminocystis sp. NIES-3709]|uniref:hypothetical protein n=1 Tax=Geminocystis sp. NIES-3709 TaxID=1617448 RepID=UPI00082426C8|nr:hypothetical protein [Geminocystis sp. NIES-3709]
MDIYYVIYEDIKLGSKGERVEREYIRTHAKTRSNLSIEWTQSLVKAQKFKTIGEAVTMAKRLVDDKLTLHIGEYIEGILYSTVTIKGNWNVQGWEVQ